MKQDKYSVFIIGGGNVAKHLAWQFTQTSSVELAGVWNRHPEKWNDFPGNIKIYKDLHHIPQVDTIIIAVKDDAIEDISRRLPEKNILTVHTSGIMPVQIIQSERKGVFYPLQSLSADHLDIPFRETVPLLIHAENKNDLILLKKLASSISNRVFHVDDQQRSFLHLAAVYANNFTRYLLSVSYQILKHKELDFNLLTPLIKQTFQNIDNQDPFVKMTGPAIRNDHKTIEKHLRILRENFPENYTEIYQILTQSIKDEKKKRDSEN